MIAYYHQHLWVWLNNHVITAYEDSFNELVILVPLLVAMDNPEDFLTAVECKIILTAARASV